MSKKIAITVRLNIAHRSNNFKSAHVVIIDNGKILIVKRSLSDMWMPGHYALPGGKIENSETVERAIARECLEETNLIIDQRSLVCLSEISTAKNHGFYYTTQYCGNIKLDHEHDDFKWVDPKDLTTLKVVPDMIMVVSAALNHLKCIKYKH